MKFDVKKFYFEDGLYVSTEIDDSNLKEIFDLIFYSQKVDAYCPYCEKETIFQAEPVRPKKRSGEYSYSNDDIFSFEDFEKDYNFNYFVNKDFKLRFKCIRQEYYHSVYFIVRVESRNIFKVGQNPSSAELSEVFKSKDYEKILPKSIIIELNKSIGLNSHGIGIGAFVYLRRTFEFLIEESHKRAAEELENWNEEKYVEAKMNRRVELLKSYLPDFLVQNKNIYGILSKGIHELKENECKSMFPLLKSSIELILDEKVNEYNRTKKIADTTKFLNKVSQNLK